MSGPWRPWRPGDDPLEQRYMTPEQVADLVRRVRAKDSQPARKATTARWNVGARQLTAAQVVALREERAAGRKLLALARTYGVSEGTALRIATGERYRDVGGPRTGRSVLGRRWRRRSDAQDPRSPEPTGRLTGELKESAPCEPIAVKHNRCADPASTSNSSPHTGSRS